MKRPLLPSVLIHGCAALILDLALRRIPALTLVALHALHAPDHPDPDALRKEAPGAGSPAFWLNRSGSK
jgi:hypothetical protein